MAERKTVVELISTLMEMEKEYKCWQEKRGQ